MDKENARKDRKQVKALVEGAFKHFGKDEMYQEQFIKYFKNQGMSKEEADQLWVKAYAMKIIEIERRTIISRERSPRILSHATVFIMAGKED